jgi:GT2 family glycosyltransferase
MKIGITAPMHWSSNYRVKGNDFIKKMVNSINSSVKYDYSIYVIDNGSQYKSDIHTYPNVNYTFIEDQSIGGITHAYNVGIHKVYTDNCDIIIVTSDDVEFNDTINKFVEYISRDSESLDCIYGPVTNGVITNDQLSQEPGIGIKQLPVLNGFTFAFTRQHYEKYRPTKDTYLNEQIINKWHGQEDQFITNVNKGAKCIVLNFCWLMHDKQRGWKKCLKEIQ